MRVRRLNSTFAYAVRLSASTADQNKASNKHEAMEKVGFNIRSFNKGGGGGVCHQCSKRTLLASKNSLQ